MPKPTSCKHFHGIQHATCGAGLALDYWKEPTFLPLSVRRGYTFLDASPCLGGNPALCPSFETYTAEELAQQEAEFERQTQNVFTARAAIVQYLQSIKAPKDVQGSISCPICSTQEHQGTLRFSSSSYNGHIRAKCSTPGCVHWIE